MGKDYVYCQSCNMPLKMDPRGGGTLSDGSKSSMYCSFCFRKGDFAHPHISVDDMQALIKRKLMKMGFPQSLLSFYTNRIKHLERWKNSDMT